MSDDVAISVQNLTKIYKLYDSPQHRLKESLHPLRKKYHRDFYALNDVSFEVNKGEAIGIIGRNGSGKSTLLKTITGVLTPSSGYVTVNGRISALLELGAGFNPQLTGMENIYFNGTITGYSREQVDARLDDVLSFADIGDFIHQPVKTYSSGMFVRLAFAVAVSIDPDILIVDEAMAVGDARFTKKCYDRFGLFRESGKTILLVSHAVETVKTFTDRALFLDQGAVQYIGESKEAVKRYLRMMFPVQHKIDFSPTATATAASSADTPAATAEEAYCLDFTDFDSEWQSSRVAQFEWIKVFGLEQPNIFHGGETIRLVLKARWQATEIQELLLQRDLSSNIIIGVRMQNVKGFILFSTNTFLRQVLIDPLEHAGCTVELEIDLPRFCRDEYFISPVISLGTQSHHTGLVTNENLIHLSCFPPDKFFCLVNSEHRFKVAEFHDEETVSSQYDGAL